MRWLPTHLVDVVDEDEDAVQTTVAQRAPISLMRQNTAGAGTSTGRFGDKDTAWTARPIASCPELAGVTLAEGMLLQSGTTTWVVDLVVTKDHPVTGPETILQCRQMTV